MNSLFARIEHVSESVVEPLQSLRAEELPAGDSFEALYRRTFPRVYGYVASLLRDSAAAEDVTAQAFERAYRKRHSFRATRGSSEAWIFGIARNAALLVFDMLYGVDSTLPSVTATPDCWCALRSHASKSMRRSRRPNLVAGLRQR